MPPFVYLLAAISPSRGKLSALLASFVNYRRFGRWITLLLAAFCFYAAAPARAGGVVTNCVESALRTALIGGGLVTLTCDSTIPLSSPIVILRDTILDGTGHTVGLGAQTTNLVHMFVVPAGVTLELRNLLLTGGRHVGIEGANGGDGGSAFGAAILIQGGVVRLDGCTLSNHVATGGTGALANTPGGTGGDGGLGMGGAIFNDGGTLFVTNSVFIANRAEGGAGGEGGGGANLGNGSRGGDGGDGGWGRGGAIYNSGGGVVVIHETTFSNNAVEGSPAGLGGLGAGVFGFAGRPGDSGGGAGAALYNEQGSLTVVNSTFHGNSGVGSVGSLGDSGAGFFQPDDGTSGGAALGGGLFNALGTVALTNCTFVGNTLSGGSGGDGGAGTPAGFGSDGADGGDGGPAFGGGVFTAGDGLTVIVNCTFVENRVLGGLGGAGGAGTVLGTSGDDGELGRTDGAALFNADGTLRIRNSILAHGDAGANVGGTVVDEGFNFSSDQTPLLSGQGSRNSVEPLFGSFTQDGGRTRTMTLASNSPAINAITVPGGNGCPPFDQRGAIRGAFCDVGAYEFGATLPVSAGLRVESNADGVVLSWPANGDFVVQRAASLAEPGGWVTITNQPTLSSGRRVLNLEKTNRAEFYRLQRY